MAKKKTDEKCLGKKSDRDLTSKDINSALFSALSAALHWLPPFERSKVIVVEDPRNEKHLIGIHNTSDGIYILEPNELKDFIKDMMCDDCKANVTAYSVIHTGQDLMSGEFDEDAPLGLAGAHEENEEIEGDKPVISEAMKEELSKPIITMRAKG